MVDRYFALWNERGPERRRELIEATFAVEANYAGPLVPGTGHDTIASLATQVLEHLDAHRFARIGEVDSRPGYVRYRWEIVPAAGAPAFAAGVDFGVIAADGRFQSVTAFFDVAPEGALANH